MRRAAAKPTAKKSTKFCRSAKSYYGERVFVTPRLPQLYMRLWLLCGCSILHERRKNRHQGSYHV